MVYLMKLIGVIALVLGGGLPSAPTAAARPGPTPRGDLEVVEDGLLGATVRVPEPAAEAPRSALHPTVGEVELRLSSHPARINPIHLTSDLDPGYLRSRWGAPNPPTRRARVLQRVGGESLAVEADQSADLPIAASEDLPAMSLHSDPGRWWEASGTTFAPVGLTHHSTGVANRHARAFTPQTALGRTHRASSVITHQPHPTSSTTRVSSRAPRAGSLSRGRPLATPRRE